MTNDRTRIVGMLVLVLTCLCIVGCEGTGWRRAQGVPLVVRPPGQYVYNGMFEISSDGTMPDYWRLDPERSDPDDQVGRSYGVSVEGKNFMHVLAAEGQAVVVNRWGPMTGGRSYRLAFHHRGSGTIEPQLAVSEPGRPDRLLRFSAAKTDGAPAPDSPSDKWRPEAYLVEVPEGVTLGRLELVVTGDVQIDMVTLERAR